MIVFSPVLWLDTNLPSAHLVPKGRRIDVDATYTCRIDVHTTSFLRHVPAGLSDYIFIYTLITAIVIVCHSMLWLHSLNLLYIIIIYVVV